MKLGTSSGSSGPPVAPMDRAAGELRTALKSGMARLEASHTPSAPLAAELLLMQVLRCDRTWLYAHPEYELSPDQAMDYAQLIERRSTGVPTQYLTGRQEFWGLEFEVGPGVLVPRPETEHVIEVALARLGARRREPLRIADVGTGSGCIAIALAHELPQAAIIATDISAVALDYARKNAERHKVEDRIQFHKTNLLEFEAAAPGRGGGFFDLIVSNPPYVGRKEAANLPREVREHEPAEALFAGDKGLELYASLIDQAAQALGSNGIFVVEIGHAGAEHVASLLSAPPWANLMVTRDLAGIERVISARLSA